MHFIWRNDISCVGWFNKKKKRRDWKQLFPGKERGIKIILVWILEGSKIRVNNDLTVLCKIEKVVLKKHL